MINWLGEWLKDIILVVLLASFVDLILPSSNIQKYARVVLGLLIILVILNPIIKVFDTDYSLTKLVYEFEKDFDSSGTKIMMESLSDIEKKGSDIFQQKILAKSKENMKIELSKILKDNLKVKLNNLDVEAEVIDDIWQLNKVTIYANEIKGSSDDNFTTSSNSSDVKEVERVKVGDVKINSEADVKDSQTNEESQAKIIDDIKELIFEKWELPAEKVAVILDS